MKIRHYLALALSAVTLLSCSSGAFNAASQGDIKAFEAAIADGGNINEKTMTGKTPLYGAAAAGKTEMVRYLVSKGADLEAKDYLGRTALGAAKLNARKDTEAALLKLGADAAHCGVYESPASIKGKTVYIDLSNATRAYPSGRIESFARGDYESYQFTSGNTIENVYGRAYHIQTVEYSKTGLETATISDENPARDLRTYELRFTSPTGGDVSGSGMDGDDFSIRGGRFSVR